MTHWLLRSHGRSTAVALPQAGHQLEVPRLLRTQAAMPHLRMHMLTAHMVSETVTAVSTTVNASCDRSRWQAVPAKSLWVSAWNQM